MGSACTIFCFSMLRSNCSCSASLISFEVTEPKSLPLLPGLRRDLHLDRAELLGVFLRFSLFAGDLRGLGLLLEAEGVEIIGRRLRRELARQEVVAGITVGNFLELALFALTLYVCFKMTFIARYSFA